jgi:ATP-dependent phosphoenolpyruvate carboxykinase
MKLSVTRKIIDAVHDGSLEKVEWENFPEFNF